MTSRILYAIIIMFILIAGCKKKCGDINATNSEERGDCEYLELPKPVISLMFNGKTYTGSRFWDRGCTNVNSDKMTTVGTGLSSSDFKINLNGSNEWCLDICIPVNNDVSLKVGDNFVLGYSYECKPLPKVLNAYIEISDLSGYNDYMEYPSYSTGGKYTGKINITKITDGAIYNEKSYWIISGNFECAINIDGKDYQITNGVFTDTKIPKTINK